jgi:hypothetical protein
LSDTHDDPNRDKITKKHITFRVTEAEAEALRKLATELSVKDSNLIRRGIRLAAKEAGVELAEGIFSDKPGGNWLPKNDPAIADDQRGAFNNTVVSVTALTTASSS